ncbi:MAG TPA: ABC transporter substrate-binding protein [Candidatus Limnocylindrales bacterium]|nr:ABC transporter substrate-binding protein [Candidatus Limnocylindrales bacterium]
MTEPPASAEDLLFSVDYEPVEGQAGGSAVIGEWQAVANLNSYYDNSFTTSQVLAATMRGLWLTSSSGHWKPDLAAKMPKFSDESIRQNDDGSFEVDLELRSGLKWSDGTDLTLNDLRYTWEWVLDPDQVGLVSGTTGWEDISEIEVSSDGLSATVFFDKAYAGFYGLLGQWFVPEHYFSEIPVSEAATTSMPVSPAIADVPTSGPYQFVSASPNGVELERNENWVGGSFDQGAYLDSVTFQYYADKDGMIAAFLAGDLDVALDMTAADYASIQNVDPSIGEPLIEPAWLYEHLDMNQGPNGHPMLADVNVRKAIYQAIDRSDLYATLFPGYPVPDPPACSPAPPGTYWRDAELECPPFDADAAAAALEAAGWTDSNGDGTIDKDGREAVLEACTSAGNPTRQLTLEKVSGYLADVGITINITLADAASVYFAGWNDTTPDTKCSIYRGTYDLALFAWVLTFDLFGNYFYSYHTDQWPDNEPHDGGNTSRFSHPDMDEALETLRDSINTEDQIVAVQVVQQIYVDQIAEIPLYYRQESRGKSVRLQNFFKNPGTASDMWNIEDWWIQE